ncbi:inositol monophosphatase [Odoribacter sp. OttesenSCG-928-G04]|nr:inositol monophosphatase [Odoribacter sp. OttesenSCG-928-G04]
MNLALDQLLKFAVDCAIEAGKIHLTYFRKGNLEAETKSSVADVVTRADKESERFILAQIKERFPEHAVLGEEGGMYEGDPDYCWVVDPLDGTNNFNQGLPVFAVSIAFQYKGEAQVGVVYAPYLNELYTAVRGEGALMNGRPIRVSDKKELNVSVLATGFPYDKGTNPENNISNLATLLPGLRGIRRMGAAAYDLCCVAAGFLDGYWELNLYLWDICAGALIVEEAGGVIHHFRNDRNVSIIAGNREIVEKIRAVVK